MSSIQTIALLGFLPWTDEARGNRVRENPSAIAAEAAAAELRAHGADAHFVAVAVSAEGISAALDRVRALRAGVVVALGQTSTEPRVERYGRVPGTWAPQRDGEPAPWTLAPDADALAVHLNAYTDASAQTQPFRTSDDAGAYFCDHLCVELVRDMRDRGGESRFLHVTAIDGCEPGVREARLRQYARQARAAAEWLRAARHRVA